MLRWTIRISLLLGILGEPCICLAQEIELPQNISWHSIARKYAHEPSVQKTIQAALRYSRLEPGKVGSFKTRARARHWVPQIRFGATRGIQQDQRFEASTLSDLRTDDDISFDAVINFDLQGLIFAKEETSLLREERFRALEREQLTATVVRAYFERRRLQLQRDATPRDARIYLKFLESEALIDALTGGWFLKSIRRAKR